MRIAMVSPQLGDAFGQERVMRESAALLRRAGHQVFFLGDTLAGNLPDNDGYSLVSGLSQIHHLTGKSAAWDRLSPAMRFLEDCQPNVIHLIDQFDYRFLRALTETYPTVLTAHTVAPTCPASHRTTVSGVCKQTSGYSCLWHNRTQHCLDSFRNDLHRLNAVYGYQLKRTALKGVERIIANSDYIRTTLLADGWPEEKVSVVYNPVIVHESDVSIAAPENLLVAAARLVPMKGLDYLLQALSRIKKTNWTLWICGEGSERDKLKALISELGLSDRVELLGKTSLEKTHAMIQKASLVIQPNLGPESFGLTVAESGALGKTVVAYDVPGVNELITHGRTGWLVARGDISGLAKAIQILLGDPHLCKGLGAEAKLHMAKKYSGEKHLKDTLNAYSKCIEASRISTTRKSFPLQGETNQTS